MSNEIFFPLENVFACYATSTITISEQYLILGRSNFTLNLLRILGRLDHHRYRQSIVAWRWKIICNALLKKYSASGTEN